MPLQIPTHLKSYSPHKLLASTINEGPLAEEASTLIKIKSEAALAREQALNDKISFLKILYRPKHIKRVADAIERD